MANNASSSSAATTLNAAASAISSADPRYPTHERHRRWKIGCWRGLSCFGSQKRATRIVPASRIPEGNASSNRANGAQPTTGANQPTGLTPSLLAPPSSPASFTNSGNPSSVQSPNGFLSLSANICSPGGPTSTMFATGPYAHETQLVSPPVFSTFTTEPSTAPLTPPPELAHLTTPSSPDVPFAQLLASSLDVKTANKENGVTFSCSPYTTSGYIATNDLQAAYQLYPGSPASQLVSPKPGVSNSGSSFSDLEFPAHWNASLSGQDTLFPKYEPSKFFNLDMTASRSFMLSQDSGRFGSTKLAELCLDQAQTCQSGGRQYSSSQETDAYYDNGGTVQQNRDVESNKPDMEQLEAYRASFGFSADEVKTSNREVTEVLGDSLVISPFVGQKTYGEFTAFDRRGMKAEMQTANIALFDSGNVASMMDYNEHDIEAQSIDDNVNPKYNRPSGGVDADSASETKTCAETNGLENFSRFGEFRFDGKDGSDASSSIIEKWTRYKKKRTAENGLRDHDFFHMKQPQEELKVERLS